MLTQAEAQRDLVDRYRAARQTWRDNPSIRAAAETLGMSEREYCNRLLREHRVMMATVTGDTNSIGAVFRLDFNAAFKEAGTP